MDTEKCLDLLVFQKSLCIARGQLLHLRFGPMDLFLEKSDIELKVKYTSSNDWLDSSFSLENPYTGMLPETLLETQRIVYSRKIDKLRIFPCLGERSFVAKPLTKLTILPGNTIKFFMSTPMSLCVADDETGQKLIKIPVINRPLTWFGPSTTVGELCFFTQINAALAEDELPFRPHRAITHVNIFNRSKAPLEVEKLRVPVPYFYLFQKENGRFITSSLDVLLAGDGIIKDLKVRPPRTNIKNLTLVEEPQMKISGRLFGKVTELLR